MNPLHLAVELLAPAMLVIAFVFKLFSRVPETVIQATAEKLGGEVGDRLVRSGVLARELEKARGIERQQLRFESYGELWKALRPLAIYDDVPIDRKGTATLSSVLSDWYFSKTGGLFLTNQLRDFYFALQDLLRVVAQYPEDWQCERLSGDLKGLFLNACKSSGFDGAQKIIEDLSKEKESPDKSDRPSEAWKSGVNKLAASWRDHTPNVRFAILQQVGSILRTAMVRDIESRLR